MSPLEFMQRLAALVPRPRLHLIRFHGVLAPNAALRVSAFRETQLTAWGRNQTLLAVRKRPIPDGNRYI